MLTFDNIQLKKTFFLSSFLLLLSSENQLKCTNLAFQFEIYDTERILCRWMWLNCICLPGETSGFKLEALFFSRMGMHPIELPTDSPSVRRYWVRRQSSAKSAAPTTAKAGRETSRTEFGSLRQQSHRCSPTLHWWDYIVKLARANLPTMAAGKQFRR